MKKTVGLAVVVNLFFGIGLFFGQEVSADAEKSFRRYLELAPNAADADQIRALIDEMGDQQGQDAEVQKVYRMMASDDYRR